MWLRKIGVTYIDYLERVISTGAADYAGVDPNFSAAAAFSAPIKFCRRAGLYMQYNTLWRKIVSGQSRDSSWLGFGTVRKLQKGVVCRVGCRGCSPCLYYTCFINVGRFCLYVLVYMYVCLSDDNFPKPWRRKFIFAHPI